ncbi:MAG: tyrosine-type recombinase/integrase [Limnohabitans sp.]
MSVREHPTKPGVFIVDCRPSGYQGKRVRTEFEGSRDKAEKWERMIMRRHVDQVPVTARAMGSIYHQWISYYRANRAESTAKDVESCWRQWLGPKFAKLQPKVLTRAMIEAYKAERIKTGIKPRTVTKELSYFSAMLDWAADNDLCDRVPFKVAGYNRKMTAPPKPRPLTPSQITQVHGAIEPEYRLIFLLMADAGLRISEALHLRREDIEFGHGVIFVIGKGNKERIVPITTDRLQAELDQRREVVGLLSVNRRTGRPFNSIKKALDRAALKVGLGKHLHAHLLRHSFGTNATAAHYDLSALQAIMGHSSVATTGMYQHLAGEYLRSQGRLLQEQIDKEGQD